MLSKKNTARCGPSNPVAICQPPPYTRVPAKNGGNETSQVIGVLSCIDYRVTPELVSLLYSEYKDFDIFVLAGASLGACGQLSCEWCGTFANHLNVMSSFHQVRELLIVEHLECGAYANNVPQVYQGRAAQIAAHTQYALNTVALVQKAFPSWTIRAVLVEPGQTLQLVKWIYNPL